MISVTSDELPVVLVVPVLVEFVVPLGGGGGVPPPPPGPLEEFGPSAKTGDAIKASVPERTNNLIAFFIGRGILWALSLRHR